WMHTDEWDVPAARPGLVRIGRRARTVASLRAGHVLTREGACLGVDEATGGPAVLSWRDAGGGVLLTGAAERAVRAPGPRLPHAAIRRRKPAMVVDLAGGAELPGTLAGICASVRSPLHVFGVAGGPRYEPRVRPDAGQHAALCAVPWGPRPGLGAGAAVTLDAVVRQRAVARFALAGPGDAAEVIAGLIAADVAALYGSRYRDGIAPDGLCWFTECDGVDPAALAGLVAAGSPAGLAPVLATAVPRAAGGLAGRVNAAVIHRAAPPPPAQHAPAPPAPPSRPASRSAGRRGGEGLFPAPPGDGGDPRRSVRHNACSAGAGGHLVRTGQRRIRAGHRVDSGASGGAAARRSRPGRPGAVPYGQRAGSRAAGATGAAQGQRPSRRPAGRGTPGPVPPRQLYLGWQFALLYEAPGLPPRLPVPPDPERLNPGWVTAQRREEHLISRPAKRSAAGCLLLAGLVILLGWAGRLNPALTGLGAV